MFGNYNIAFVKAKQLAFIPCTKQKLSCSMIFFSLNCLYFNALVSLSVPDPHALVFSRVPDPHA